MRYYEKIDGSKYRNIWVVGDLHGCYTNLMNKLDTIGFDNKKDLLISVGDLVDRGAENVECLELITFPWFRAVRGNHEQMMIDGLSERGNVNHWLLNGGGWFFTRATAAAPQLRFNERNIHKQCVVCNQHKSGNLVPYRVELISRIGQEAVDEIESNHNRHRWTIEECKAIKAEYQQKLKDLRNSRSEAA